MIYVKCLIFNISESLLLLLYPNFFFLLGPIHDASEIESDATTFMEIVLCAIEENAVYDFLFFFSDQILCKYSFVPLELGTQKERSSG